METVYSFTVSELWAGFLAICIAVVAINNAVNVIREKVKEARKPEEDQNEKIKKLEENSAAHLRMLASDKERLEHLEKSQSMQLRGIYALLEHALDGNNVQAMEESKTEIKTYLFTR